ncbi:SwmB domain-containing protein [Rhodovulum sp. DZ06]|uniref:SwmB domain-containing protein n=1 Tax=Rhodovulum sp. DZ06 TaxID=3425126 RepID=UPI003D33FB7C
MTDQIERIAFDADFLLAYEGLGENGPEGVEITVETAEFGAASIAPAPSGGMSLIPEDPGDTPVFTLSADGETVLSFDPLTVELSVAAGEWRFAVWAETPAGIVGDGFDIGAGDHALGFAPGQADDATSFSFALVALAPGQDFHDVVFTAASASEVTFAPGYDDPYGDGAGDPAGDPHGDGSTDGSTGSGGDGSVDSGDDGPDLLSLTGVVADGALTWTAAIDGPATLRLLVLPRGTEIRDEADFNAWFDQGHPGAVEAEGDGTAPVSAAIPLAGIDAPEGYDLWAALEDPEQPGHYLDAAMAKVPASGGAGGGPLAELVWEPGHDAFVPTLELSAPAPGDVTATVELFVDDGAPAASVQVTIPAGATSAAVVFPGFVPSDWPLNDRFEMAFAGLDGPAAREVDDSHLSFDRSGAAMDDPHDDPTDGPADGSGDGTGDGSGDGSTGETPGETPGDETPGDGPHDGPYEFEGDLISSLTAQVAQGAVQFTVALPEAGAWRAILVAPGTVIDSPEAFDAIFAAGAAAAEGRLDAPGAAQGSIALPDGMTGGALWVAAVDPSGLELYVDAARVHVPADGAPVGGPPLELDQDEGQAAFTATLSLETPATAEVQALVMLYDGAGTPVAQTLVVIPAGASEAPARFPGFDPAGAAAQVYEMVLEGVTGPASVDAIHAQLPLDPAGFAVEGPDDGDGGDPGDGTGSGDGTGAGTGAGTGDGSGGEDDGPEILSFALRDVAEETPVSARSVTVDIAFDWQVSGVTADNFMIDLFGTPAGEATVGTPATADGGFTWSAEVTLPEGLYRLQARFVVDASLSATGPAGEQVAGPAVPEIVADADAKVDRAGPEPISAFVNGDKLHVAFNEGLDGAPDAAAFSVLVDGAAVEIIGVETPHRGSATFLLARPVDASETVTLVHGGGGASDPWGNPAPAFELADLRNATWTPPEDDGSGAAYEAPEFEFDEDGAMKASFVLENPDGTAGPIRLGGAPTEVTVTPPQNVSVAASVSTPTGDADARVAAVEKLKSEGNGVAARGARRMEDAARDLAEGEELAIHRIAPTAGEGGAAGGPLELKFGTGAGVKTMVGLDASGLGEGTQVRIAGAEMLQVSGKAQVALQGVRTAVMDRGAQEVELDVGDAEGGEFELFAGGGGDTVRLAGDGGRTRVDLGAGDDVARASGLSDDTMIGGLGNDDMSAGRGDDVLRSGVGKDVASGGVGADTMFGGRGRDTLRGDEGADEIRAGAHGDKVNGGDGADALFGQGGGDLIFGGRGDDRVFGGKGDDTISGGKGDDMLTGQQGDDDVSGGAGNDRVFGGDGADRLDGGADDDRLGGGAGADVFVFGPGGGVDVILDFEDGVDRVALGGGVDWAAIEGLISDAEGGAVLALSDADRLVFEGVAAESLDEGDFLFG